MLKKPDQAMNCMGEIAATRPELLSAQLLALSGEFLQASKRDAEATVYYNFLKDNFLKSAWLDYAYAGLGAMELAKGNTSRAIALYTLAVDEYAGAKIKESTLGLAHGIARKRTLPRGQKTLRTSRRHPRMAR